MTYPPNLCYHWWLQHWDNPWLCPSIFFSFSLAYLFVCSVFIIIGSSLASVWCTRTLDFFTNVHAPPTKKRGQAVFVYNSQEDVLLPQKMIFHIWQLLIDNNTGIVFYFYFWNTDCYILQSTLNLIGYKITYKYRSIQLCLHWVNPKIFFNFLLQIWYIFSLCLLFIPF